MQEGYIEKLNHLKKANTNQWKRTTKTQHGKNQKRP